MSLHSITLRSADGSTEAEFVPEANLVCSSLRHDGAELLHQGEGPQAYAERGKTMGIPLLHPWANRLAGFEYEVAGRHVVLPRGDARIPTDGELPIHGVLPGLLRWETDQLHPDALRAVLRWEQAELLALFPFRHELEVEAVAGNGRLDLTTTIRPTGQDPVPVSFGYHPYLHVRGTPRERWRIDLGAARRLVLDDRMLPTGESVPVDQRSLELDQLSFDDAFDALLEAPAFRVTGADSALTVEFGQGYAYAQVYAPHDQDFICFEPMTAPANALISGDGLRVLMPGEEHRASFTVTAAA